MGKSPYATFPFFAASIALRAIRVRHRRYGQKPIRDVSFFLPHLSPFGRYACGTVAMGKSPYATPLHNIIAMPNIHFDGLIIAVVTFFIIGIFHPVVIKTEYWFGTRAWPAFAILGTICVGIALFVEQTLWQALLGVLGCTLYWCIVELFHQKKRVEKGWYPKRPK
jgi:hypothetical protein